MEFSVLGYPRLGPRPKLPPPPKTGGWIRQYNYRTHPKRWHTTYPREEHCIYAKRFPPYIVYYLTQKSSITTKTQSSSIAVFLVEQIKQHNGTG